MMTKDEVMSKIANNELYKDEIINWIDAYTPQNDNTPLFWNLPLGFTYKGDEYFLDLSYNPNKTALSMHMRYVTYLADIIPMNDKQKTLVDIGCGDIGTLCKAVRQELVKLGIIT